MLFNSLTFLLFHFVAILLYWVVKPQKIRAAILLVASMIFYGSYYWPGLILLAVTTLINYGLSHVIEKNRDKAVLGVAVSINLLLLFYFKYSTFLLENIVWLVSKTGVSLEIPVSNYWLPLGISFYTFQIIGYLIDVYRGEVKAEKSLLFFAVFVSFYAQLIAGPIVRAKELLPQLKKGITFDLIKFQKGFFLIVAGLFIKICGADVLSQFVEHGFTHISELNTGWSWLVIYGFSIQILCDFWGYSTIAVGIGLMYGISLPINFNLPYIAQSCQDFWRRWHITLSEWFRDYLYIPLGGNKGGKYVVYKNLILTMTIAGIWHGAGWNFLLWGLGHGLWLAIERRLGQNVLYTENKVLRYVKMIIVFHLVALLWVFFRATDFNNALDFFGALLAPPYEIDLASLEILLFTVIGFILFHRKISWLFEGDNFTNLSVLKQVSITSLLLLMTIAYAEARLDFIYFIF